MAEGEKDHWDEDKYLKGLQKEESESGKYSLWVHVKNGITITDEDPDATAKNNPSYTYSYNGDGRLQYIDMSFGSDTWRKTLAYTSGRLTNVSAWVLQ